MTEQPAEQPPGAATPDATEPADSAQRRLVEQVASYEVDPPAPERARPDAS